jgi:hypothetical protein
MTVVAEPPVRVRYRLAMQRADVVEWCREARHG